MRATDIEGLSPWELWPRPALERAPETSGVYVFKLSRCFGRMRGESDIVYVGLAEKSIKGRLGSHRYTEIGLSTNLVEDFGTLQVAWKPCGSDSEARFMESTILGRHRRDHVELPPFNRQQPFKVLQQYFEALGQLGNVPVSDGLEDRGMAAFRQLEDQVARRPKPVES
jgi:hypothetical protein